MKPADFLKDVPVEALALIEGRIELTKYNPMLFALIYMPHHLKNEAGEITLSEFHVAVSKYGLKWIKNLVEPKEIRDGFIAPRGIGKSTWLLTILPMWAAAHGHIKYLIAFSDSAAQAEGHLQTFKTELETNEYLNADFPDLCAPARSKSTGRFNAYSNDSIWMKSGFVFNAYGIDSNVQGKKAFTTRPDLIILDDIEKGEKNYSEYQAHRQRNTVFDDIAPMNMAAKMVFVGTTTMPNSIMDQFRKYAEDEREPELNWIEEQNVKVHYYPAIMTNEDGTERSIWPEKWSLEWLNSQRKFRDFAKGFMNRPMSSDGQYWALEDVRIQRAKSYGNTVLSIDPAVTKGKTSDYTGLVVVSRGVTEDDKLGIWLRHAMQFKGSPEALAIKGAELCEIYDVGLILVETNQGGDLWKGVFKDIPAKYRSIHQKLSKEIRAAKALNFYQQKKVYHDDHFPVLEEQMYGFPKIKHDDVLDSATSGILYFLDNQATQTKVRQYSYMGGR